MLNERETLASFQRMRIDELEKFATVSELKPDPNYILRSESDAILEAMRRSLMDEFESQRRAQAASCAAELATRGVSTASKE